MYFCCISAVSRYFLYAFGFSLIFFFPSVVTIVQVHLSQVRLGSQTSGIALLTGTSAQPHCPLPASPSFLLPLWLLHGFTFACPTQCISKIQMQLTWGYLWPLLAQIQLASFQSKVRLQKILSYLFLFWNYPSIVCQIYLFFNIPYRSGNKLAEQIYKDQLHWLIALKSWVTQV